MPGTLRGVYPPINTPKPVAPNVWIVDGEAIEFGPRWVRMPFPTRMTEFVFFHRPSRTLILADLIENFEVCA